MSKSIKASIKQSREPPPSLFLGPPSLNASYVTLSNVSPGQSIDEGGGLNVPNVPFLRQTSPFSHQNGKLDTGQSSVLSGSLYQRCNQDSIDSKVFLKPDDAQWAEMQRNLKEAEISTRNGPHVFGSQHSNALEQLRNAQIELAKAWARSEAEEAIEGGDDMNKGIPKVTFNMNNTGKSVRSTAPGSSGKSRNTAESTETKNERVKEPDFEADIITAKKRRETNDKYFQNLNDSILDVVSKLENLASSMKVVAEESKNIWENLTSESSKINADASDVKSN